jgi:Domain of unknown function (DUF4398)
MTRMALAIVLVGACSLVHGEPPVAQFAGAQLRMAQAALDRARSALERHDFRTARHHAAQAALDTRLAWGMSGSAPIRRFAMELNRQAERLRWRVIMAAGAPLTQ